MTGIQLAVLYVVLGLAFMALVDVALGKDGKPAAEGSTAVLVVLAWPVFLGVVCVGWYRGIREGLRDE